MSPAFRTPAGAGLTGPLRYFRFDERDYTGFAGDTLASALLANGVHLSGAPLNTTARAACSPRARRSRTPWAPWAGRRTRAPNLRATQVELYEGLSAYSQNRWPGLAFDIGAINDFLAPFMPAGFYYKTFMWPGAPG